MRLTSSQKSAIISLLQEKYFQKEKQAELKFEKENKELIESDKQHVNALREEFLSLAKRMLQINEEIKHLHINCTAFSWDRKSTWDNAQHKWIYDGIKIIGGEISSCKILPDLDFAAIERQLEIDSIGNSFDIENFLRKYLE